jgi:phospholipid transport system substrate-binding protein
MQYFKLGICCLLVVLLSVEATNADNRSARSTVERFNATLSKIMQNASTLRFSGRYASLEPVLLDSFDIQFMAQFSAGRHWRMLSEDERNKLVGTFGRLWVSTYADRFNGYDGESFEIVEEKPAPRNTILVKTNIIKNNGKKVAIDYLLRKRNTQWYVIDIFLSGKYSELAKQRAEYTSVLKRKGFIGLVDIVEEKIQRMAQLGN